MTPEIQTAVILDAMGLGGSEVSGPSKMRAVASMVEALDKRLRDAIREGRQPLSRMKEFRNGQWPERRHLVAMVQQIQAKADAAVAAAQAAG